MTDETTPKTRLTGMQSAFVREYAACLNGTMAARKAGYAGADGQLAVQASQNLRNPKIKAALELELEKQGAMSKNEVLMHITDIARGDIADTMNSMGGIDPLEAARRGKSHLVKRFKVKTTTIDGNTGDGDGDKEIIETEVEMYSREWALGQLAKYYGLTNAIDITSGGQPLKVIIEYADTDSSAE